MITSGCPSECRCSRCWIPYIPFKSSEDFIKIPGIYLRSFERSFEMKWNHILDCQPECGREIIQIDAPYEGHYSMGMRKYHSHGGDWNEYINYCKKENLLPNYWWMYAEDFPFPDKNIDN